MRGVLCVPKIRTTMKVSNNWVNVGTTVYNPPKYFLEWARSVREPGRNCLRFIGHIWSKYPKYVPPNYILLEREDSIAPTKPPQLG